VMRESQRSGLSAPRLVVSTMSRAADTTAEREVRRAEERR